MTGNKIINQDIEQIIANRTDWIKFNGKSVLISGANGFLPAYMVEVLCTLKIKGCIEEIQIYALVRNIEKAQNRFRHYLECDFLHFIVQDVCKPIKIDGKVDYIIHAASQASPKYYGIDPVGTLNANVLGTSNLLELAKTKQVQSFLYFSSSEVYGAVDDSKIPTKEHEYGYLDPTKVRSCYAESKRMGENICVSFLHQFNVPVKIVRPFHTYGPGLALDDGRVYADFIADLVNNNNIVMKSDGSAKRAFCYLSDATIAFFTILLDGINGEAYNMGNPSCETSIVDLAQLLLDLFPEKKLKLIKQDLDNSKYLQSQVSRNCPDISKIKTLGWFPTIGLKEGFYRTLKSYE